MPVRSPLTREDWIHAAQQVLIEGGIDAVRVDNLAKELRITRGSFYYHFKSRGELLAGILSHWRTRATEDVIKQLHQAQTVPKQQLERLLELPFHGQTARQAASIELAIRAWARRDEQARQTIDEVDNYRLGYIQGILIQLGIGEEEASDRAWLMYACQIGSSLIQCGKVGPERRQRMTGLLFP